MSDGERKRECEELYTLHILYLVHMFISVPNPLTTPCHSPLALSPRGGATFLKRRKSRAEMALVGSRSFAAQYLEFVNHLTS